MPNKNDILTLEECQSIIDSVTEWEAVDLVRDQGGRFSDVPRGGQLKFKQCKTDFWKHTHPEILLEFVMKYDSGDFCGIHIDSMWWEVKKPYIAVQTWITPLNDDYEGGELYVDGKLVEQKVGVPVKFNRLNPHEVTEVTKGTRHSLVAWVFGSKK